MMTSYIKLGNTQKRFGTTLSAMENSRPPLRFYKYIAHEKSPTDEAKHVVNGVVCFMCE
jgi:hypothetical protein